MKVPVHLNALRAFEASARHQSFAAAASELNVTPAAVGQLVRTLEDWLGTPLFHRATSGRARLVPTEAAERALPDLRTGFDRLSLALDRLREGSPRSVLTVTVSPAFAAKWLLPRLESFQSECPETDIRLDTSLKPVDFVAQRIDIGVRYGAGHWPGLQADKLLDEEVFPVCSPLLKQKARRLHKPADLLGETLVHDLSMAADEGFPTWNSWLRTAGVTHPVTTARGLKINNAAAVLQAAIDGQGVALARSVMAHDDIASGRLLRLFPSIRLASPLSYYVVYRAECADMPCAQRFRQWLLRQAS
jgi:LysR family glycine cleavage system transcriptional activator